VVRGCWSYDFLLYGSHSIPLIVSTDGNFVVPLGDPENRVVWKYHDKLSNLSASSI